MAKRENLMLAHVFKEKKHGVAGWFMSEKLDGMRCFFDGGISRGVLCSDVPYANTEKDFIRKEPPIATGLWSRYFKAIQAPDWWLDRLPQVPLDGELFCGRGRFQDVMSYCKKANPIDVEWEQVEFKVFDRPCLKKVFSNPDWALRRIYHDDIPSDFEKTYRWLEDNHPELCHEQIQLPFSTELALAEIEERLVEISEQGGEGLMLRKPTSLWTPQRSHSLLKVKKYLDGEGLVVGYTSGRRTDKGSKLLGKIGALVVEFNGKEFELSGLTEEERTFEIGTDWAEDYPGQVAPHWCVGKYFKIGDMVRFKYRELTRDGIPKEARYWR